MIWCKEYSLNLIYEKFEQSYLIALVGPKLFCERIVKSLKEKEIDAEWISKENEISLKEKIRDHSIIHYVSSPTVSISGIKSIIYFKILGKKILVNWIGWDVLKAIKQPSWRLLSKFFQLLVDKNIATSKNLVEELEKIGIHASYQPIPVYSLYGIKNLPTENKIAIYLPDNSKNEWNFYQGDLIKKLVTEFPQVEFIIVRNSGKNFSEKNTKCIKWVENMEEIYTSVKAVIRLPLHDGTSGTTIESLSMGRTVITSSQNVPFCKEATNFEDLKNHVSAVINESQNNIKNSEYIHKYFNPEKLTKELVSIYNSLGT